MSASYKMKQFFGGKKAPKISTRSNDYEPLIANAEIENSDSMTELRINEIKEERVRNWSELKEEYPCVDEPILYQVYVGTKHDKEASVKALKEMGMKPGFSAFDDDDSNATEQEVPAVSESIIESELALAFPDCDSSIINQVVTECKHDPSAASAMLQNMGFTLKGQEMEQSQQQQQQQQLQEPEVTMDNGVAVGNLISF